jgi:hypothetical protein
MEMGDYGTSGQELCFEDSVMELMNMNWTDHPSRRPAHQRRLRVEIRKCMFKFQIPLLLGMLVGRSLGQKVGRVKIAQGEYVVSTDGDLGIGPMDTEVFHFHESWTLWRSLDGNYEVDGERNFESPRGTPHKDKFWDSSQETSVWSRSRNLPNFGGYPILARWLAICFRMSCDVIRVAKILSTPSTCKSGCKSHTA